MPYQQLVGYLKIAESEYNVFILYVDLLQDTLNALNEGCPRDDIVPFDDSIPISALFVNVNLLLCHVKDTNILKDHIRDSIALLQSNIEIWESLRDSGELDMMRAMARAKQGQEHESSSDQ
jgi:hypothetical protein